MVSVDVEVVAGVNDPRKIGLAWSADWTPGITISFLNVNVKVLSWSVANGLTLSQILMLTPWDLKPGIDGVRWKDESC